MGLLPRSNNVNNDLRELVRGCWHYDLYTEQHHNEISFLGAPPYIYFYHENQLI